MRSTVERFSKFGLELTQSNNTGHKTVERSPIATPGEITKTFEGTISDSQCALNVHSVHRSHQEMLSTGVAGKTDADCARFCVQQRGGRYVLETKHDVFKLSNQEMAEKFAGEKVKVTGTLDRKTNVIEVKTIEPLRAK
jgi:hypothetical protein